jgi:flagellar basal body-associated protein FliL
MAKDKEKDKEKDKPKDEGGKAPAAESGGSGGAAPMLKGRATTFAIFGGVMLVEGVAIFACMKFLGNDPDPTLGMQEMVATSRPWSQSVELPMAKVRVPNNNGARTVLYSVSVVLSVHHGDADRIKEFMENRKNTIDDVISRVIRSADEGHMSEPGLETLKRQIRYELGTLFGDDKAIEQVLIPECTPIPAGF